jgi:glutaredoxin
MSGQGRPGARALFGLVVVVLVVAGASQWWAGRTDQRMGAAVAALARPGDIHMLSSASCPYCARARIWMTAHKVPFSECFIERDAACRATFDRVGADGTPTMLVRNRTQRGFDPQRVLKALEA